MEDYAEKVSGLSDESLDKYIVERRKYVPEIVLAALAELQKRGRIFSEDEINAIHSDLNVKKEGEAISGKDSNTITADETAPELYSRQVIRIFGILFSAIFGSVMMAMNLSRMNQGKAVLQVVSFGVAYSSTLMWVSSHFPQMHSLNLPLNIAGGYLIEFLFWDKYIGKETVYRKRRFWIPLLIALATVGILIYAILSGIKV